LLFNLYIYLHGYILIKQINKMKKKHQLEKKNTKSKIKYNLYLYIYILNKM